MSARKLSYNRTTIILRPPWQETKKLGWICSIFAFGLTAVARGLERHIRPPRPLPTLLNFKKSQITQDVNDVNDMNDMN
jgi:hypothetical protein